MSLTDASFVPLEKLRYLVRSVRAAKLYYVTAGRNAWWSTWIKRYEPGCMHISFESARSFAEKRRVQGTVFYIVELPTIAIFGSKGILLISEINSQKFFSRFSNSRLKKLADTIPVSTMTLNQLAHIFRPKSSLWAANYPIRNSAILTYKPDAEDLENVDQDRRLRLWTSQSVGRNYGLHWTESSNRNPTAAFNRLVTQLNTLAEKPEEFGGPIDWKGVFNLKLRT